MNYKKSYLFLMCGLWGGIILAFIGLIMGQSGIAVGNVIAFIGLIGIVAGMGQAFRFYKCPKCGKRLNMRGRRPDYCPACGKKLDF